MESVYIREYERQAKLPSRGTIVSAHHVDSEQTMLPVSTQCEASRTAHCAPCRLAPRRLVLAEQRLLAEIRAVVSEHGSRYESWRTNDPASFRMSAAGNGYDKIVAKGFSVVLEKRLAHCRAFRTRAAAYHAVSDCIENYCKAKRGHSSADTLSSMNLWRARVQPAPCSREQSVLKFRETPEGERGD